MKFNKIIAIIVCVACIATVGGVFVNNLNVADAEEPQQGKKIDVYLMAGQSNMVGTSRLYLLDEKYQESFPTVKFYNGGDGLNSERNRWVTVHPGQGTMSLRDNFDNQTESFGPELGMAKVLHNTTEEIAFIKYAYGGTAIFQNPEVNNTATNKDNWHGPWDGASSGRLYNGFLQTVREGLTKLKQDGYEPIIKGLAWMQGETDGEIQFNNERYQAAKAYEHNLTELFNAFRNEISTISGQDLSQMPIVFGEIYEFSTAVKEVRTIVEAQYKVGQLANNYMIETGDLAIDSRIDDWHWNGTMEYMLGIRFGEKLYELTHEISDVEYDDGYVE